MSRPHYNEKRRQQNTMMTKSQLRTDSLFSAAVAMIIVPLFLTSWTMELEVRPFKEKF
jgi:hypothetical protein